MRSETERPYSHQAVVEIYGIPFCGACAREQEAYFAMGELTQEEQDLDSEPLAGTLERMWWERATGGIAKAGLLEAISNDRAY